MTTVDTQRLASLARQFGALVSILFSANPATGTQLGEFVRLGLILIGGWIFKAEHDNQTQPAAKPGA
jgi:hypothetical protein